jgi:hypothetical protein
LFEQRPAKLEHFAKLSYGTVPDSTLSYKRSNPGEGITRNRRLNPVQSKLPMHLSPRSGARTRRGTPCKSPAMLNGRCRMHGGRSPGAPKGNQNALKHGYYSAQSIAERREMSALLRTMRVPAKEVSR